MSNHGGGYPPQGYPGAPHGYPGGPGYPGGHGYPPQGGYPDPNYGAPQGYGAAGYPPTHRPFPPAPGYPAPMPPPHHGAPGGYGAPPGMPPHGMPPQGMPPHGMAPHGGMPPMGGMHGMPPAGPMGGMGGMPPMGAPGGPQGTIMQPPPGAASPMGGGPQGTIMQAPPSAPGGPQGTMLQAPPDMSQVPTQPPAPSPSTSPKKSGGGGGGLLAIGVILAIIGAIALVVGKGNQRQAELVRAAVVLDPAKISAAERPGLYKVRGKLLAEQPARMQGMGEAVAYGSLRISVTVREYDAEKKKNKSTTRTLFDEIYRGKGLAIEAGGTSLPIDDEAFRGAEIHGKSVADKKVRVEGSGQAFSNFEVVYGDVRKPIPQSVRGTGGHMPEIEVWKVVIPTGADVFLIAGLAAGDPKLTAPREGALQVVAKDETVYLAELDSSANIMVPAGFGGLGLGGLLIVVGLLMSLARRGTNG